MADGETVLTDEEGVGERVGVWERVGVGERRDADWELDQEGVQEREALATTDRDQEALAERGDRVAVEKVAEGGLGLGGEAVCDERVQLGVGPVTDEEGESERDGVRLRDIVELPERVGGVRERVREKVDDGLKVVVGRSVGVRVPLGEALSEGVVVADDRVPEALEDSVEVGVRLRVPVGLWDGVGVGMDLVQVSVQDSVKPRVRLRVVEAELDRVRGRDADRVPVVEKVVVGRRVCDTLPEVEGVPERLAVEAVGVGKEADWVEGLRERDKETEGLGAVGVAEAVEAVAETVLAETVRPLAVRDGVWVEVGRSVGVWVRLRVAVLGVAPVTDRVMVKLRVAVELPVGDVVGDWERLGEALWVWEEDPVRVGAVALHDSLRVRVRLSEAVRVLPTEAVRLDVPLSVGVVEGLTDGREADGLLVKVLVEVQVTEWLGRDRDGVLDTEREAEGDGGEGLLERVPLPVRVMVGLEVGVRDSEAEAEAEAEVDRETD